MSEKNGMSAKNSSEASEENMSLEAQQTSSLPGAEAPSIVVGIGASAGGLEAIQELLKKLPDNTGMAFVIIQHLSPDYKSMLSEILCKFTMMPVLQAENNQIMERNTVYLIPPKYNMEVKNGRLVLHAYIHTHVINHPIDIFFRSLANEYETKAIAVVLSGTGSDGTNGIRTIKEQGGVILVQRPETAKFDGMPRSALSTGFSDLSLSPEDIAGELTRIAETIESETTGMTNEELLNKIYSILKKVSNVNYTYYKRTTVTRRIERRMVVNHIASLYDYVNYLLQHNDEAATLAKDVLIGVTSFFRDPECFEVLKESVVKPLLKKYESGGVIRVWVAGCSTGEEAYSIAILFMEAEEELNIHPLVKIFATDLDKDAIMTAGKGQYGENIIEDVSAQRLSQFFTKKNKNYIVSRELRKMVVFAPQNVFQDPPFGKLDLISCRNMLIYFQNNLQKDLFAIFHMSLNDGGYMFLGRSEAVSGCGDIYSPLCSNEKIFIHNSNGHAPKDVAIKYHVPPIDGDISTPAIYAEKSTSGKNNDDEVNLDILERFLPPCLVVDEQNIIRHLFGDCNDFLHITAGKGEMNLFNMLIDDLKIAVSTVLKSAKEEKKQVSYDRVPVHTRSNEMEIAVVATPIKNKKENENSFFAIVFLNQNKTDEIQNVAHYDVNEAAAKRISDLEDELSRSQIDLKKTVSELETVNEELQATNEELLTANEELQSSNEELQSVNEELYTVNAEYQEKLSEVTALNNDISNFLSSTMVGIIFLDDELQIRKFTEYVSNEFSVMEHDIGRPIRFMNYNFINVDLVELCQQVAEKLVPVETDVLAASGKKYFMRISAYRTSEKKIVGLVLTFVDTSEQLKHDNDSSTVQQELLREKIENREKDSFLSRISHDVRTPLNAIMGTTQLMQLDADRSTGDMEQLKVIETNVNYLLGIFNEILETSRIKSGKVSIQLSPVDEYGFLENIISVIDNDAEKKGITLTAVLGEDDNRYIMLDKDHMSRVLVNLLGNAIKYTPEGGKVDFNVKTKVIEGNKVVHEYTISDNGVGMSQQFQSRMFQPFEQEAEMKRDHVNGQGLGLYIVKTLIDAMKGDIKWKSVQNQGTTFTVTMTYDICPENQLGLMSQNKALDALKGSKVLVCEDQSINADIVRMMLSEMGVSCDVASNGRQGVEMFDNSSVGEYSAILMDLRMPVMDGREATIAIRAKKRKDAKNVPVLFMTADVFEDDRADMLQSGGNDFIYKPVDMQELYRKLCTYIVKK